jgi:hypothetical protein
MQNDVNKGRWNIAPNLGRWILDQCSKALDVKKMENNIEIIKIISQFIVCWPLSLPKRRSKIIKLWKVL